MSLAAALGEALENGPHELRKQVTASMEEVVAQEAREARERQRTLELQAIRHARDRVPGQSKFSPLANAIFVQIVPNASDQLQRDPSVGCCKQLIKELEKKQQKCQDNLNLWSAYVNAVEDVMTLCNDLEFQAQMGNGDMESRLCALGRWKWSKLVPFLHTIS